MVRAGRGGVCCQPLSCCGLCSRRSLPSSVTFSSARSNGQFYRSQIGMENGAPRRHHAGAELFARHKGELARGKRIRPVRCVCLPPASPCSAHPSLKTRMTLPCFVHTQVYAERCHRGSLVDQEQCRASSQPARAQQGHSASFSGRPARARRGIPQRPKRAAVASQRTVRVQLAGPDLLRRECNSAV